MAARFARLLEQFVGDAAAAKAAGQQRDLMGAIHKNSPATLNEIAAAVGRGAPAVSRAVDKLVRAGHVSRQADPDNRRRLQLALTDEGGAHLERPLTGDSGLEGRLAKLA
ncbi:MAG: MarR family transcriptional regulator, partial [Sphingomicrobium sp.]